MTNYFQSIFVANKKDFAQIFHIVQDIIKIHNFEMVIRAPLERLGWIRVVNGPTSSGLNPKIQARTRPDPNTKTNLKLKSCPKKPES